MSTVSKMLYFFDSRVFRSQNLSPACRIRAGFNRARLCRLRAGGCRWDRQMSTGQDADDGNKCCCSGASRRAPQQYGDETSWRQAQLAEPQRSSPCPGNRQDAEGNRRRMQGGSPEPCRRRDFPAQEGRPYRRAGWKALRHIVDRNGTKGRGLTKEKEPGPTPKGAWSSGVGRLRWHVQHAAERSRPAQDADCTVRIPWLST